MTCKDCIHYEVCCDEYELAHAENCNNFKDKSKYIELPCKVGDTLYYLDTLVDNDKCAGCSFYYEGGMGDYPNCEKTIDGNRENNCIEIKEESATLKNIFCWMYMDCFNKTVFLTKSEAEQKLKELKENANS